MVRQIKQGLTVHISKGIDTNQKETMGQYDKAISQTKRIKQKTENIEKVFN